MSDETIGKSSANDRFIAAMAGRKQEKAQKARI
jgi:hypothetical protein